MAAIYWIPPPISNYDFRGGFIYSGCAILKPPPLHYSLLKEREFAIFWLRYFEPSSNYHCYWWGDSKYYCCYKNWTKNKKQNPKTAGMFSCLSYGSHILRVWIVKFGLLWTVMPVVNSYVLNSCHKTASRGIKNHQLPFIS